MARRYLIPLLLLPALSLHGSTNPTLDLIRQSEAMVKSGKASEAADALRAAAQKTPEDFYLVYNGGIASYVAGKYQDALESFTQASSSPDERIRSLALMQIGNAEFQLSKSLLKATNRTGAALALERAVETYQSALTVKSNAPAEHNLQVAKDNLESVLMSLGNTYRDAAQKAAAKESKILELTKVVTTFDRVTQINAKNQEAKTKLAEARKDLAANLRDQARELAAKAEQTEAQAQAEGKDSEKHNKEPISEKAAEKLNEKANESYQQARENAPDDKELAKEHDEFRKKAAEKLAAKAEQKMQAANAPSEKTGKTEARKQEQGLTEAVAKADQALAFDENNKRAQDIKTEALKKLEEAKVAQGDALKEQGDKTATTTPEAAANAFSEAMQKFQGALELNSENQHAKEQLAKTQEALAKSLAANGQKEMAMAKTPGADTPKAKGKQSTAEKKAEAAGMPEEAKPDGAGKPEEAKGEGAAEAAKTAAELRQEIGHMEKAAQSFAQAEALAPGKNDAAISQAEALAQLAEKRAALDQAQNKPPGAGKPGDKLGDKPGDKPGDQPGAPSDQMAEAKGPAKAASQSPVKPVLNFSDIRSTGQPQDGIFKDLRQKSKIRDW